MRVWLRLHLRLGLGALLATAALLSGCASFDVSLRRLALRPTPGVPADFAPGSPGEREHFGVADQRYTVAVPGSEGRTEQLALWWLPQADPTAPALLYLHGTFRNLYQNLPKIEALRQAGFAIVAVDYRGWGESTAIVPSEATIAADARRAWEELRRRQPDAARRVIFGHSMGGAAAVTLASGLHGGADYAALVLESTFTRMSDIASAAGFWGRVLGAFSTLEFDSQSRIGLIDAPVWMLHGSADQVVPVALGRRLWQAAPAGATWIEVPGGSHSRLHSEAPELYQRTMKTLIEQLSRAQPLPPAAAAAPRAPQP